MGEKLLGWERRTVHTSPKSAQNYRVSHCSGGRKKFSIHLILARLQMFKKGFFPLFFAIDLQKRAKPSPGLLHTHCNENLSGAETKHFGARPGGSSMASVI